MIQKFNFVLGFVISLICLNQTIAQPNITRIEYYLDTDPGQGKGVGANILFSQNVTAQFNIETGSLISGLHIIGIRSLDANGVWSFDERWLLVKDRPVEAIPNLQRVEYFLDTDPGAGKGSPLAIQPNVINVPTLPSFINVTSLTAGIHKIGIRSLDTKGAWSFDDTVSFTINSPVGGPYINVNSLAYTNVCAAGKFTLGFQATGTYHSGNQFIAELSDSVGNFVNPTRLGLITDTQSNLINCQMPTNIQHGTGYKMRVSSTSPSVTGNSSNQSLSISVDQSFLGADTFVVVLCAEDRLDITNYYNPANSTITWSVGTNPTAASVGIHTIYATNAIGCQDSATITISLNKATWLGTISNNWHTTGNWSNGKIPDDSTHVIIPAGTPNPCVISQQDAIAASVQILNANAILRINTGRKLLIVTNCQTLPSQ